MDRQYIKQPKISDVIMEKISNMILEGSLKPGQKLPPERELSQQFNTSRPSLRAALHKLEAQGLIKRIQGGGTYVSDKVDCAFTDPLINLFKDSEEFKFDVLEYRHALEETSCYLAAKRATETDKELIKKCYDDWLVLNRENKEPEVEAQADVAFHLAIAEASHNVVLPHAMRFSMQIMKHSVTTNLRELYVSDGRRELIQQQHQEMLDAILEGDGEMAREAVRKHLAFVKEELESMSQTSMRIERAERRKSHLNIN